MIIARIFPLLLVFFVAFANVAFGTESVKKSPVPINWQSPAVFTLPSGETHWYVAVYLPAGGLSWDQSRELAEQAGGYLVTLHSDQENEFVYGLVRSRRYWSKSDVSGKTVLNGPFIGGFKPEGAHSWQWVSGEKWTYEKWGEGGCSDNAADRAEALVYEGGRGSAMGWEGFASGLDSLEKETHGFIIEYEEKPVRLWRKKNKAGRTVRFSRLPFFFYKSN